MAQQQPCQNHTSSEYDNTDIQIQTTEASPHSSADRYNIKKDDSLPPLQATYVRYILFACCMGFLFMGRFTVPENDPPCIVDKIMDILGKANEYILTHPTVRDTIQILCSAFMDIMALTTFYHWIHYNKTSRFILSVGIFYGIRALIQMVFYLPFPQGYWWNNPGFPSLVVPYGRGSDFFFSGHSGFIVICASEWLKAGNLRMAIFIAIGGVYTMFVLILFRIHYSIDILAGVIIAHWCFLVIDSNKEQIDRLVNFILNGISRPFLQRNKKNENGVRQKLLLKAERNSTEDIELQNFN